MARPISEADAEDYKQQDREDKRREMLERRARMGGPDAPDACEACGGAGHIGPKFPLSEEGIEAYLRYVNTGCLDTKECPRCLGTGVQS